MLPDLSHDLLTLAAETGGGLLALDASTAAGSLCIVALEPGVVDEVVLEASSMPSESLAGTIGERLATVQLDPRRLAAIVVGLGPGSFTGLRVALATVKGLAYGGGVRVYGVSSLALIAAGAGPGLVAPVLDARRGDVFCALYEVDGRGLPRALVDDDARTPAAFAAILAAERRAGLRAVGYAPPAFPEITAHAAAPPVAAAPPRAAAGLLLAAERIRRGAADSLATLTPRYLRVSEAERVAAARAHS